MSRCVLFSGPCHSVADAVMWRVADQAMHLCHLRVHLSRFIADESRAVECRNREAGVS